MNKSIDEYIKEYKYFTFRNHVYEDLSLIYGNVSAYDLCSNSVPGDWNEIFRIHIVNFIERIESGEVKKLSEIDKLLYGINEE